MRMTHLLLIAGCLLWPVPTQPSVLADDIETDKDVGIHLRDLIIWTDPGPRDTFYPVSVNNWYGYMNQRGHLVLYPQFDWVDDFYDSLARAVADGKTGYIKTDGQWVHKPIFPYADRFAQGRAVVGDGEHFGYIDKAGNPVTPIKLDGALRFNEDFAAVMKDGKCGFINLAGDLVIDLQFKQARSFHDGFAAVVWADPNGGADVLGYVDKRGEAVFTDASGKIEALGDFHDGLARIKGNGKWGFLGKNWKLRIDARFDDARDFTQGIAAVRIGSNWGFIDKTGRLVIEPVYDAVDDLDNQLILVTMDNEFGYINRVGDHVIEPQFTGGLPYFRDLARVELTTSFAYIDRRGKPIWDPRQALNGFINQRAKENAVIEQHRKIIHHRTVDPPEYRDPIELPYPPDHLYEPVLPKPER